MDKKQKFLIGAVCSALLGLIALLMPLAPFVSGSLIVMDTTVSTTLYSGFDFIFGDFSNGGAVAAWVLILVGLIFALGSTVIYFLKKEKIASLVLSCGGLLILVGGILYFFFIQFAGLSDVLGVTYSLFVGGWLGGIFGIIAGAVAIFFGISGFLAKGKK